MIALLGSLLLALPQTGPGQTGERTDEQARAAWSALSADERFEVVEWFRSEARWLETFQAQLVRFVLDSQTVDTGAWPLEEPAPVFDPQVHCPGQPIPRKPAKEGDAELERVRKRIDASKGTRKLRSAWRYTYGADADEHGTDGGLVKTAEWDSLERIFENALAGFLPEHDLAEALVERMLDDGSMKLESFAFSHAYTDRAGKVFTGVTLYDAWCSGIAMEMPDVDTLGILHTVVGDWKTYVAPVPPTQHEALYAKLGELFAALRRHRGLRHALARCYLAADPAMRDGYDASVEPFHALWDYHASTPTMLGEALPESAAWTKYLSEWNERIQTDGQKLAKKGRVRQEALRRDAQAVRRLLLSVMERFGAFEPRPEREAEPEPAPDSDD